MAGYFTQRNGLFKQRVITERKFNPQKSFLNAKILDILANAHITETGPSTINFIKDIIYLALTGPTLLRL